MKWHLYLLCHLMHEKLSVGLLLGAKNTSLVTASQAIFIGNGSQKAPAAVVGVQLKHSAFVERFFNITGTCMSKCKYKCTDKQMDCYLIDNNGFVIVSEVHEQVLNFQNFLNPTPSLGQSTIRCLAVQSKRERLK
ncbi:hypothetical protein CEXT_424741 [Caerostris extrusa]|uniref:Voltage-dependent calcium channel alpha-2/delta subunit conserved region domain-containing protein n=1 Tax=Caerostris extrusa TaxID=172846 RepID=A0AAV4V4J8_CAEEX|nr:hypothetical protein CEXT_424741 [Caerostris extrusa]